MKRMRRSTGSHSLPGTFNMLGNCEKMKQRCKDGGCLMRCDLRINLKLVLDLLTRPVPQMREPPPSISLALRPPLNPSQEVRPVPYIVSSRDARPPRSPPSTLHRVESRCSAAKKSAQYPTSRRVAMLGPQEVRPVPYIASSRDARPPRSPPSTLHRVESRCTAAKKSTQYPT